MYLPDTLVNCDTALNGEEKNLNSIQDESYIFEIQN